MNKEEYENKICEYKNKVKALKKIKINNNSTCIKNIFTNAEVSGYNHDYLLTIVDDNNDKFQIYFCDIDCVVDMYDKIQNIIEDYEVKLEYQHYE